MHEKWRQMPPLLFLRHDGKMSDLFIELQGITKRFPGVVANDRVDLTVHRGEIHAIVGENGAGKSTLMRVLYGLYQPDEGTIAVKGHAVTIESPRRALELGIGMVHQHFMLIPVFTVAENVILGSEPVWGFGRLRLRDPQQRVAELCRHDQGAAGGDDGGEAGAGGAGASTGGAGPGASGRTAGARARAGDAPGRP